MSQNSQGWAEKGKYSHYNDAYGCLAYTYVIRISFYFYRPVQINVKADVFQTCIGRKLNIFR